MNPKIAPFLWARQFASTTFSSNDCRCFDWPSAIDKIRSAPPGIASLYLAKISGGGRGPEKRIDCAVIWNPAEGVAASCLRCSRSSLECLLTRLRRGLIQRLQKLFANRSPVSIERDSVCLFAGTTMVVGVVCSAKIKEMRRPTDIGGVGK